ncbi:receptor-type tyrosine-protein phosphatase epsilon-like [Zophobas morio]|uniref:receptor-type tyrosine-protein phosphatase epsilon-like n=1 Tax=Zophobas morio TaxID=2755281 RepID=UPI003082CC63
MKFKILCSFFYVATSLCSGQNGHYCVTEGDAGLVVSDKEMGKDGNIGSITQYLDNVASINLDITQWQHSSWNNSAVLQEPILDERWETFLQAKADTKFEEILNNSTIKSVFLSVRIYKNLTEHSSQFNKAQWYHLKFNENVLYICETDPNITCNDTLDTKNISSYEFYVNTTINQSIWILHEYQYFYTHEINSSLNVTENSTSCSYVKYGWIKLHVAMCSDCKMSLELQSNDDTNKTETFDINGNGHWKTSTHYVLNFTTCFKLMATTIFEGTDENEPFWAIGDKLYFSKNENCANTTRYIKITIVNNDTSICEDSRNNPYNITQKLPTTQCYEPPPTTTTPLTQTMSVNSTRSSKEKESKKIETSSLSLLYLLIIIPVLLIVIGVALFFYIRNKKATAKNKLINMSDEELELLRNDGYELPTLKRTEDYLPIKTGEFDNYIHDVFVARKNYNYLEKQFSNLPSGYLKDANEGQKNENSDKNRYNKIYPYDENRVKLAKSLGDANHFSDYINASYVEGVNGPKDYILTQNPLKNTAVDFFRMIWQEQVEYVVMVSTPNESYHRYWPDFKKMQTHNNEIEVFVDEMKTYEFFDCRTLIIQRFGEKRKVQHLHFYSWSPKMVSSHIFLEFVDQMLNIPHVGHPVVFHCLAGIGRSATLVLCDIALRSGITGYYNFFDTTKKLRECRAGVIPNPSHYKLAHLIVFESSHYKDTSNEINSDFEASFSRLLEGNSIKKKWSTYLENTDWLYEAINPYQFCTEYPPRNRYIDNNLLPTQHSRVALQYKKPDYIHAMFVSGYSQRKDFIVAQQPLSRTVSDFWIMILQNHVTTVINLNEPDVTLRGNVQFIPTPKHDVVKIQGNITIQFTKLEEHLNYEKLTLAVHASGKFEKNVEVLNIKNWPKIKGIPESTDVMMSIWENVRGQKTQNFPTLVCCDDGISSSSLVVCFFYMADKMLQERKCDVVGAVKAVRRSHTKFINFEQFVFLHHCALAFYKNCYKTYGESL